MRRSIDLFTKIPCICDIKIDRQTFRHKYKHTNRQGWRKSPILKSMYALNPNANSWWMVDFHIVECLFLHSDLSTQYIGVNIFDYSTDFKIIQFMNIHFVSQAINNQFLSENFKRKICVEPWKCWVLYPKQILFKSISFYGKKVTFSLSLSLSHKLKVAFNPSSPFQVSVHPPSASLYVVLKSNFSMRKRFLILKYCQNLIQGSKTAKISSKIMMVPKTTLTIFYSIKADNLHYVHLEKMYSVCALFAKVIEGKVCNLIILKNKAWVEVLDSKFSTVYNTRILI